MHAVKKPPDKYRTIKLPLDKLKFDGIDYAKLDSAVIRSNKLSILTTQMLRCYHLYNYTNEDPLLVIDKDAIKMAYRCLTEKTLGPPPEGNSLKVFKQLTKFYNKEFKFLTNGKKIDGVNLSRINDHSAVELVTNIENNIKMHFFKYVRKVVNIYFREMYGKILDELPGKEEKIMRKILDKDKFEVYEDLINYTSFSDNIYHEWISNIRNEILPKDYEVSYEFDIKKNPQKYITSMITINNILERKQLKQYQFFPLKTSAIPKYIQLETKSMVELFVEGNKKYCLGNIGTMKDELWNKYFDLDQWIFKLKNYKFDYCISTDGYAASVRFIHVSYIPGEIKKKENKKKATEKAKKAYRGLTEKQKEKIKEDQKLLKEKETHAFDKKRAEEKAEFKKKPKEERAKIIAENKKKLEYKKKSVVKKEPYIEFPYFDKLNEEETKRLSKLNLVYIDPGKKNILYMVNNKGTFYRFTNRTRIRETKRLKYARLSENYRKKNKIEDLELTLSKHNSKSCDYETFRSYVKERNKVNEKVFKYYETEYFKKLKWYTYINTRKSEEKLLKTIMKIYGKDAVLIMGDWKEFGNVKHMSTPGISLKRKLAEKFKVYNLDEFRTSCLNNKTETRCENIYLTDKEGKFRKIHSVLTYKQVNNRSGCINRDKNSVLNMRKIVQHYLKTGERIEKYRRGKKIEEVNLKEEHVSLCVRVKNLQMSNETSEPKYDKQ